MAQLEEVFGVTSKQILSYVTRTQVDDSFRQALTSHKQIIVYGSSKQGKTALVSKHLPYDNHLLVSLTPKTQLIDIYQSILSRAGIRIVTEVAERASTESTLSVMARFKALIPLFVEAETEVGGETKAGSEKETKYEAVPVNLELPQTVADLLARAHSKKWVILENFHYLPEEVQQQFAFDLRAFQELGVRFVILGVWREKNRMAQFNGDLLDRTVEVPVEPWTEEDFRRVASAGGVHLNVEFADDLLAAIISASFSSIGVFQELLRLICVNADVRRDLRDHLILSELQPLTDAIRTKTNDYGARHERALEAIAAGHNSGGPKNDQVPLFLPYYMIRCLLEHGFDGLANGVRKQTMWDWIRAIHHRAQDVRSSDMTNLLEGTGNLQSAKSISPPILAYDAQQRILQVVDSTFYFFIKNANLVEVLDSIQDPVAEFKAR